MVKRFAAAVFAVFCFIVPSHGTRGEPSAATEYELKAAFLYNFAKFVQWPPTAFQNDTDPIVLGVVGEDPFGNTIDTVLQGITIQNRPLIPKRVTDPAAENLQILFISPSEKKRLPRILAALNSRPVLTVSDIPNFIDRGGMIGFEMQNNRVRFGVNKTAADTAHLQFSSQVLKLATTVKEE